MAVRRTLSRLFSFFRCFIPSLWASTCCLSRGESTTCNDPTRDGGIPAGSVHHLQLVGGRLMPLTSLSKLTSCRPLNHGGDPRGRHASGHQAFDGHLRLVVDPQLQLRLLRLQLIDVGLQRVHGLLELSEGEKSWSVSEGADGDGAEARAHFSFFFSRARFSSSLVWIFSTRSSASLVEVSSFFSSRLRRTLASLSSSPWEQVQV